jgi:lipoprotein signal peptidase
MRQAEQKKQLFLAIVFIAILTIIDQVTKQLAIATLSTGKIIVIPNFFELDLVFNTGMAFGMLEQARLFFIVATVLILIYAWKYYKDLYPHSKGLYFGGIMFFAGTLGNFIDRLLFGKVTDFFAFIFGSYHFAVFNVADILLTCSVPLLIWAYYVYEKKIEQNKVGEK